MPLPIPPPPKGHFVLHTNFMPPMTAGGYRLVTSHSATPFPVATESTYVNLAAPRYQMPVEQILSSFPPANAEGAFSDRLPQIVLKRRTLPWERNPAGGTSTSPTPWLALVVVAEGEAELSTPVPVAQCVTPGITLRDAADRDVEQGIYLTVTETVKNKIFPCEQDLPLLCHVRHVDVSDTELANGDDDGWLAVVLANRLPVYDIANDKPVRYLACLINLEGQLASLPPPVPPDNDGFGFQLVQDWMVLRQVRAEADSMIIGNVDIGDIVLPGSRPAGQPRLPRRDAPGPAERPEHSIGLDGGSTMSSPTVSGQWSVATVAVAKAALDPDASYVVRDTMGIGFRNPISVYAKEKVYRYPVLAHWSFTTAGSDTFETLMTGLDVGLLGTVVKPDPADPPTPEEPAEVVQTGHIGLEHRTRRGDPVQAWYRGPFVPFPTERDAPVAGRLPVAHAADQLKRVVPGGREDLGLAAAFEIGRLLGLSQLSIVGALTRFRNAQFGAGRAYIQVKQILSGEPPLVLDQLDVYYDLGRYVALSVLADAAKSPFDVLGPRRPLVDPGRELKIDGDLDLIIAGGLGLDVDVIRKRADAVGIVAALAITSVPVAFEPGAIKLDEAAVAVLKNTLAAEVESVASVAFPATTEPDPLDALLDRLSPREED